MNIWAHRGTSGEAPENTLEAFRLAAKQKADGVELDVQLSKDGQIVVIHDETIDRVSDGNGFVKEYTLSELKKFNFNKTHPEYNTAEIPTLKEVFSLLKDTELMINVELKTGWFLYGGIEEKVLKLVKRMSMEDRILYSSFSHYSVMKIKELFADAKTGLLYSTGFIDVPQYAKRLGATAIHPDAHSLQYPNVIEDARELGIDINVWNVRDEDVRFCKANGISGIITNFPERSRKVAEE